MNTSFNVRSQIGQENLTEMTKKPKSIGIYKNSSDLQQGNVKFSWSISWRSGVRFFFILAYIFGTISKLWFL